MKYTQNTIIYIQVENMARTLVIYLLLDLLFVIIFIFLLFIFKHDLVEVNRYSNIE